MKSSNLKLGLNKIRTKLPRRRIPRLTSSRQRQRLDNRQENATSSGSSTRHSRSNKCFAYSQTIRQTQRTFPQTLDKVSSNPITQPSLNKPTSEKEGYDNQPNDFTSESGESSGKGKRFGENRDSEAEKCPSTDGQWAENEASDGGEEDGEELPCLRSDLERPGDEKAEGEAD